MRSFFHINNKGTSASGWSSNELPIIAVFGHSNCGRSLISELSSSSYNDQFKANPISGAYISNYNYNYTDLTPVALTAGTNTLVSNAGEFGVETILARYWADHIGTKVYVAKAGFGSTTLGPSGATWQSSGPHRTILFNEITACVNAINALGKKPRLVAAVMILGQQDAAYDALAAAYYSNLIEFWDAFTSFWSSLASSYSANASYKKIMFRMDGSGDTSVSSTNRTTVRSAIDTYATNYGAASINTDSYALRDVSGHLSAAGQVSFGEDVYSVISSYLNFPSIFYDFYLIAGQSNTGRSRVSEMTTGEASVYDVNFSNVKIMNPVPGFTTFVQINPGSNTMTAYPANSDEFGFETSLMKKFTDVNSKARFVLKHGVGASSLAVTWAVGAPERNNFLTYIDNAAADALVYKKKLRLKAFIWMQGEEDATTLSWANNYATNLAAWISTVRSTWASVVSSRSLGVSTDFKVVIGRINGASDTSEVYRSTIRSAQAAYCADITNNALLIDTDSYPLRDSVHYSATGQIQFGIDIFNQIGTL